MCAIGAPCSSARPSVSCSRSPRSTSYEPRLLNRASTRRSSRPTTAVAMVSRCARVAHGARRAARREGTLVGGDGFENTALRTACEPRGACMGIPDELAARMPLAYVHFTHLLVDALLFLAPFALYARLGAFLQQTSSSTRSSVSLSPSVCACDDALRGPARAVKSSSTPLAIGRSKCALLRRHERMRLIGEANAGARLATGRTCS